jgi:hypothetical protein
MAVPMFTANRSTGSTPSCAPTALPRVRRRLSSRPPWRPVSFADGVARRIVDGGRALLPGPDPPGFEPVRVLRGFNRWFTCVTPLCLACRTRAIWRYSPVPALSGLLPPDPASPGSGCPQLHRTAATARRWGPTPHTVQRRLMAHDLILELAREGGVMPRPRNGSDDHAVTVAADPGRLGLEVGERGAEVQRPPASPALAPVIARAAPPAVRAAIPLPRGRTDRHHERAAVHELDVFHDGSLKTEELLPYASSAHAVTALSCGSATVRSRNRKSTTACALSCPQVGRSQRPDLIAPKRGRRRLSSSANPTASSTKRLAHTHRHRRAA